MADALRDQLAHRLSRYNLRFSDLPQDETLLFGTLGELGFKSFIARSMPRKEIIKKLKESQLKTQAAMVTRRIQ